jgi:hypothetical protein
MYYGNDCTGCPGFAGATTVYVNAGKGTDNVCCGRGQTIGFGGPCATITQAMANVQGSGWTINFTGDLNGNAASSETYPIPLSNGVTLAGQSASTSCIPGVSGVSVISVDTDTSVVLARNITVGTRCDGANMGASIGVLVANGASFDPAYPGFAVSGTNVGIELNGGFLASEGYDIVFAITNVAQDGIHCESVSEPSAYSGTQSPNESAVIASSIAGAGRYGLYVGNGCSLSLSVASPLSVGPATCSTPTDNIGVYMEGNGTLSVDTYSSDSGSMTISCMNGDAIVLADNASLPGSPTLTLSGAKMTTLAVTRNGGAGLRVLAGSATVSGATIANNHWGVIQQTGATGTTGLVDLSNGGTSPNSIYCNSSLAPGAYCTAGSCPYGANVWNDSAATLNASNNYWADSPPSKCTWNNALASFKCTGSASGDTTPPDGVDVLVTPSLDGGTVGAVMTTGSLLMTTTPTCAY